MKIGIVASEVVPYAKTGGLADVAGTLFKVFGKRGNETYLFMPFYKTIKNVENISKAGEIFVKIGSQTVKGNILTSKTDYGTVVFIEQGYYFGRDELYGTKEGDYPDNGERFGFFDLAVIEAIKKLNLDLDIIHANDWQTGLIPLFIKDKGIKIGTLFTIHNLGYQGNFEQGLLDLLHIDRKYFTIDGLEFYGDVSFLKSGIVFSDYISTVSPSYAKEIMTPEYGMGMDGILRARKNKLVGILNGIDYEAWNPEKDDLIYAKYSVNNISGKEENKRKLSEELNFETAGKPLFGMVSRLAGQKGVDILTEALEEFLKEDVKVVILGTGEKNLEEKLVSLQNKFPDKIKSLIKFDNALAHKIYAASDFFMMPSKYEPCGLGQLIALKYGSVPVVRATGGLKDTIDNYNGYTHCGNGFSFEEYSSEELLKTLKRAEEIYGDRKTYDTLRQIGMMCDFSWNQSALKYLELFNKIKSGI